MARQSQIKWRKQDKKEFSIAVANYNRKLTRIQKNDPLLYLYQPERIDIDKLRSRITNRQQYKEIIRYLKAYAQKGSEQIETVSKKYGTIVTRFDIEETKRTEERVNKAKARIAKKFKGKGGRETYIRYALDLAPKRIRLQYRNQNDIINLRKYYFDTIFGYEENYFDMFKDRLEQAVRNIFGGSFIDFEDFLNSLSGEDLFTDYWSEYFSLDYVYGNDSLEKKKASIRYGMNKVLIDNGKQGIEDVEDLDIDMSEFEDG